MAGKTKEELITYFNEENFYVSYEAKDSKETSDASKDVYDKWYVRFKADKYKALFYFGFEEKPEALSPSMNYLYFISNLFIRKLTRQSDIELTRENADLTLSEEETGELLGAVPFVIGTEYINSNWMISIWEKLIKVYAEKISNYQGTVEALLTEYNSKIHVAGRVFFHLVESKQEDFPFAFLATYSTEMEIRQQGESRNSKKVQHVPLKNALIEYKDDEKKPRLLGGAWLDLVVSVGGIFH